MSAPATEILENASPSNRFQNIFNQTPYRYGLNQYTWSTCGHMNPPRVQSLASVWQQLNLDPTHRPRCNTAQGLDEQTTPQMARLWREDGGSSNSTPNNLLNTAFFDWTSPNSIATPPESDRFTIFPTHSMNQS